MASGNTVRGRRVAIISQGLGRIEPPKAYGSIAIWTYETGRYLSRKYAVLFVELGQQALRSRALEYEGAAYVYVPDAINRVMNKVHRIASKIVLAFQPRERRILRPEYASVFHNLGYIVLAAWHARRWHSDIIHIHNFSQFVPVVRALNPKAHIVLHMNCEWLSQHDPGMISRRLKAADTVMCCSGHIMRRLLDALPEARSKARVVFNGCDVERFVPSGEAKDKQGQADELHVLFVGRISPEKGVHILIEAFTKVAARLPNVILDVVGGAGSLPADFLVGLSRDPLVKKLESFYRTDYFAEVKSRIPPDLQSRVFFHGNVGHSELANHYRGASVFVCPSLSDAFPLTVVEAMAAALPVVASAVGGVPEAVVDGETGVLVEPDNAAAFAAALVRVLEDGVARHRMGAAARERAKRLFSWGAISEQVVSTYDSAFPDAGTRGQHPASDEGARLPALRR